NFNTISARIARLHELTDWQEEGKLELLPTKERMGMQAELAKLEYNLGGVRDMERLPDAVFVTDLKTEEIAVREAVRLRIPIIGLVDTNCDPTQIDYVVPGNDDAIRSCELVIGTIGGAIESGAGAWRVQEERRLAEEMARRKKEEEERKKREEEEKARVEAEEAAKKAAELEAAAKAASGTRPAGPVAGQGTSSSQAAGEDPNPAPPAGGAPGAGSPGANRTGETAPGPSAPKDRGGS
ncbi:MAG: 30S ribosomal protein S2, partial [Actinomycetota bacterium]|nr:30S ribosomal protein S2 [Actinomycetota bacterium]